MNLLNCQFHKQLKYKMLYYFSFRIGYELHSDERRCENACGGIIDTANGTITSPSFPGIYPSNKNCIWEIIAPPQWRITINFTHFDIEGNNQDCEYDSLTISSKMGSEEARNHGLFCGNKLPPVRKQDIYQTIRLFVILLSTKFGLVDTKVCTKKFGFL